MESTRHCSGNLSRMSTEKMDKTEERQRSMLSTALRSLRRSSTLISFASDKDVPKSIVAEQEDLVATCLRDDKDSKRFAFRQPTIDSIIQKDPPLRSQNTQKSMKSLQFSSKSQFGAQESGHDSRRRAKWDADEDPFVQAMMTEEFKRELTQQKPDMSNCVAPYSRKHS